MNICTICTPDWISSHLARWFRHVRFSNPTADLYLIMPGTPDDLSHPVVREFTQTHLVDPAEVYSHGQLSRPWVNEVRMSATELFDVDEMLYIDADCDVYGDMSRGWAESDKDLMWVRSPWPNAEWTQMAGQFGYSGAGDWVANNGLLYMRRSFKDEWASAWEKCGNTHRNSRVTGVLNFNVMLRDNPELWHELPKRYSVVWRDWEMYGLIPSMDDGERVMCMQWCNAEGQKKHVLHEEVWRRQFSG